MSYKMIITISVVSRVATPLEVSHEDSTPIQRYRPWPALHPQHYLAYAGYFT